MANIQTMKTNTLINKGVDLQEAIGKLNQSIKPQLDKLKAQLEEVENEIQNRFEKDKSKTTLIKTDALCQAELVTKEVYSYKDFTKIEEYILKNKAFDILNRAINQKGVRDRLEDGDKDLRKVVVKGFNKSVKLKRVKK